MAEFCLDCWNKINETNDEESKFVMSKELDFCEGCGEWKYVIVSEKKNFWDKAFSIFFSFG